MPRIARPAGLLNSKLTSNCAMGFMTC
jgi:hypothetical protein